MADRRAEHLSIRLKLDSFTEAREYRHADEQTKEFVKKMKNQVSEQLKSFMRNERNFTITRVGNSFNEKSTIGGVEYEVTTKLNEELEWKDKEENPVIHVKSIPTFEGGVLSQEIIPLNEGGGKRRFLKTYIQGDELVAELSLPDAPGVIAKRFFKRA